MRPVLLVSLGKEFFNVFKESMAAFPCFLWVFEGTEM